MAELDLKAANGTDLPYKGWEELNFSLVKGESERNDIKVPFLFAKDSLDTPIVGFNVIEEITRNSVGSASAGAEGLVVDLLNSSLADVERGKVEALVQLIKTENSTMLTAVKSRKQDTVIPQVQSVVDSCCATVGPTGKIPVFFEFDADPLYPTDLEIPENQLTVA